MSSQMNFTISDEINGPVIAAIVALEMIGSLLINSFVLFISLSNPDILKQSSIIFSTNIVVVNLLMTIVHLTPILITAALGKWVFGVTVDQKTAFCQFSGAVYSLNVYLLVLSLAMVSVDRCVFIVKPLFYKIYMKAKTTIFIIIIAWAIASLTSTIPFVFGIQNSEYVFDRLLGTCGSAWESTLDYEFVFIIFIVIWVIVIAVSTLWAFCYTKKFLKRVHVTSNPVISSSVAAQRSSKGRSSTTSSVYNYRLLKVFGMFSMFLIATAVCYTPGIIVATITIVVGRENMPSYCYPTIHLLYYLNYSLIPLIQLIFRKELKDEIKKLFCKCKK